jgi:hypothetical protein
MEYKYLTDSEKSESIAIAIREREREHHNYELNRINYEHMLDSMSDLQEEWPENLRQYQGLAGESLAKAVQGPDYDLVIRYQFRDRVRLLLATTIAEQAKSEAVYNALVKQITDEQCVAALARIDARKA